MAGGLAVYTKADSNGMKDTINNIVCDDNYSTKVHEVCNQKENSEFCKAMAGAMESSENCENDSSSGRGRAFTNNAWSANIVNTINGYGCWCYFDEDVDQERGRGHPVANNPVDSHCKELVHGYYCMKLDAENEGDSDCDPTNTEFVSATGLAVLVNTNSKDHAIWEACKAMNGGNSNCKSRACAVEGYFILNIFDLFLSGQQLDVSYKHSYGTHHPVDDCPINSQPGGDFEYVCCGEYPLRFRHKNVLSQNKSCCGRHYVDVTGEQKCCDDMNTYDSTSMQCCNNGYGKIRKLSESCPQS